MSFTMQVLTIASSKVVLRAKETAHCEGENAPHSPMQPAVFVQHCAARTVSIISSTSTSSPFLDIIKALVEVSVPAVGISSPFRDPLELDAVFKHIH